MITARPMFSGEPERVGRPSWDPAADMYRAVTRVVVLALLVFAVLIAIWWHSG